MPLFGRSPIGSGLLIRGEVLIAVLDLLTGRRRLIAEENLLVDEGVKILRDYVLGVELEPAAMALGTGSALAAVGDTALGAEVFRKAVTRRTATSTQAKLQTLILDTESNGFTVREAGIFTSTVSGQGRMLSRVNFNDIAKTSSIQLTIEWRYTIARA